MDTMLLPAEMIPSWNSSRALINGTDKNVLFICWGGLGDQVCSEPAIRYAVNNFPGRKFSLATECPELFKHLEPFFEEIFDLRKVQPIYENYFCLKTIQNPDHLSWQFVSHGLTNAVDYVSLCMFRKQIPISQKNITLQGDDGELWHMDLSGTARKEPKYVAVHAGKHWPSKTFPKSFWDGVLRKLVAEGFTPILIGKTGDVLNSGNVGTVDVDTDGCVDLRNKTNVAELIYLLKKIRVVITNDSSPLHIAASGKAFIGFIASCKHPDLISHWRDNGSKNEWAWRMTNLGKDGLWNHTDTFPCQNAIVRSDVLPEGVMEHLLPTSDEVLEFVKESWGAYGR